MKADILPLSLYVHLPWCLAKCPYCDFNSYTAGSTDQRDRYVAAVVRDLGSQAANAFGRPVETVFIGGGTPSLFDPDHIKSILAAAGAVLELSATAEITLEANPGAIERGNLEGYRDAGVTRLSLGAQSFDAGMLGRLGRIHGPDEIFDACTSARAAGFESINIDLMFALPAQTLADATLDVDLAIGLAPEHISYYQLTLEPNTVFHARPPRGLPDNDAGAEMEDACHARLAAAGYRQYEVSAFARPGFECRHNLNYWSFGDYLGVGAGAHGKVTDPRGRIWRRHKTANPLSYMRQIEAGEPQAAPRRLDDDDIVFEFMLNALRLPGGFSAAAFERRTGLPFGRLRPRLEQSEAEGLLAPAGSDRWQPTERGFRFLNDLQARFLPSG